MLTAGRKTVRKPVNNHFPKNTHVVEDLHIEENLDDQSIDNISNLAAFSGLSTLLSPSNNPAQMGSSRPSYNGH